MKTKNISQICGLVSTLLFQANVLVGLHRNSNGSGDEIMRQSDSLPSSFITEQLSQLLKFCGARVCSCVESLKRTEKVCLQNRCCFLFDCMLFSYLFYLEWNPKGPYERPNELVPVMLGAFVGNLCQLQKDDVSTASCTRCSNTSNMLGQHCWMMLANSVAAPVFSQVFFFPFNLTGILNCFSSD